MSIFVFGSNLKGIHGAGAAKDAHLQYGAEWGIGEGRTGSAYAIPTKNTPYRVRRLIDIQASVDSFLEYAAAHPELEFKVTRIGCGLAGYSDEEIAPMFMCASENCTFDPAWEKFGLRTWPD
jgi:hypothetical protein